ncbi:MULTISPECIES: ABC transporter ATP-binding protein/permease [unclassified Adlercreutzia]|uniref:ABC transporter ATP-binding protein/permease n=1 Tax=unclassified Adlercreutzia TaxID=2636013 RepID=UPI0013EAEA32|nr:MULTISPECIES: ABC transporter ATP-binding protein/permease [unclassified Adlercreutzia]
MLQLQHIHKEYTTGDFTQVALNDVSVSFRDNEFVAILGPSGSGKTTMLNIVGGLDHYDTGDLIIDGISTKQYKDRDWDTFRNNRVGFVFQSYNLIPHQTILANVELALTLSGVSRDERRERARVALAQVGLADHVNKKPSQLSGGQMQRVAIARALINDPEILLADEPTGALDSKTSVQIMDLLTEIARDRLVVMVTHNPELAEQYATRIVNLADGVIVSDSDPFEPGPEDMRLSSKQVRRTSMSFLTALSLSFNNLMTKKGRTIMTAFAGSIGIIGIAAILALANGVNNYIKSVEEETLSVYPLQIMSTGLDMTSMMVSNMAGGDGGADAEGEGDGAAAGEDAGAGEGAGDGAADGTIGETPMITRMLSSIASNDLASLKAYLDSGESGIEQYTSSIDYGYNVTPQIFDADTSNGVRQVNPDTSFSSMGMGSSAYAGNSLMSMSMSTDMFAEMMGNSSIVEGQYDVVAGHWPERYNECVLVLTANGNISDFLSYVLGLRDPEELKGMVNQFMNEEEVVVDLEDIDITYDDILAMRFKLVNAADRYRYDADYGVWVDKSDDEAFMTELVNGGEDLVISGIVQPRPEATATALSSGIFYTPELTRHLIEQAAETQIVQDQLAAPDVDVFNGKTFAEEEEGEDESGFDMNSLFSVDETALQSAFRIDESKLSAGMSGMSLDLSGVSIDPSSLPPFDASSIKIDPSAGLDLSNLKLDLSGLDLKINSDAVKVDTAKLAASLGKVMQGFMPWFEANKGSYNGNLEAALSDYLATQEGAIQAAVAGSIDLSGLQADLAAQLQTQLQDLVSTQLQAQLIPAIQQAITTQLQAQLQTAVQAYLQNAMAVMMTSMASALEQQVSAAMERSMAQLSTNMATAMSIDADAFANAFQFNLSEEELTELIMSMMTTEEHSFDNNLVKLGYASLDKPSSIDIYPVDFESKQEIIGILDAYNDRMKAEGAEDKEITYTDIVGTLMNSVTTIIDMISYVLIAFVAISLVVSSIMIGVITYISVLERKKEIGILRAIGASKGDISRVFNAETIIEGLVAGLLGVGITALGCIPASAIVLALFDVPDVAQLPWQAAAVLVLISVFLTFIAGLLPSRSASRKDPVEALRSE